MRQMLDTHRSRRQGYFLHRPADSNADHSGTVNSTVKPPAVRNTLAACLLLLCACSADGAIPTVDDRLALTGGERYMTDVIAVMQANSINRLTINWQDFRTRVLAAAAGTTSEAQTEVAMRLAVQLLGDGHSFFRFADGRSVSAPLRTCSAPPVTAPVLPNDIGYVQIVGFSGSVGEGNAIATAFHVQIQQSDTTPKAGWIVDLRGNLGGNMWPMLASVGPILGEGVAGHFIDPVNQTTVWAYRDGAALLEGRTLAIASNPYRLRQANPRVAVLLDDLVASSGEAIAVAFKARPNTRFFGGATCGVSTANTGFPIGTGLLGLTISTMADRTKAPYGGRILPDEELTGEATTARAVAWLRSGR